MSVLTPILKKCGESTNIKTAQKVHFELSMDIPQLILSAKAGDERSIVEIVTTLTSPLTSDDELEAMLVHLRDNIFIFDKENEKFIQFILKVSWSQRSTSCIKAYQDLILSLVSAHTTYLTPIIQMLVAHFLPRRNASVTSDFATEEELSYFANVHAILRQIVSLVPSMPPVLLQTVQERIPYMRTKTYLHVCYIQNLLEICQYCEKIRRNILEVVVVLMLQLDVNSAPQDIVDAEQEDVNSDDEEEVFDMEMENSNTKESKDSSSLVVESMKHPVANTLDCTMTIMLKYIHNVCFMSSSFGEDLNWEASKKLYKEFLAIFDTYILPTLGCSHVQYLLFYIVSFKAPLHEGFLDYLWKKVQNPNSALVIRQAAVSYISSLLARASYIPTSTAMSCLDVMCPWIHSYINNQEGTSKIVVDAAYHGCFYSVCQAVFYIFAFRHKELTDSKKGLLFLHSLNFERIVSSRLNPLKICLPVVVKNFANVARNFQIAYCYTIIERNNRNNLPVAAESGGAAELWHQSSKLTSFFPFEPYLLQRSSAYVASIYRTYEGKVETEDAVENEDEDDDFLDSNDDQSLKTPQTPKSSGNLEEYFSYKSSPGFKQMFSPPKY